MLNKISLKLKKNKLESILLIGVIIIYLITHLDGLTNLPVFADESIYIRWSQLIIDDWQRYLFFPMNDGKTPLFIWILVPFQLIFKDQLFAGRIVSVLVGMIQIFLNMELIKVLGGKRKTQILAGLFTAILPFWYFHHRIALMDGLLTLFISFSFMQLVRVAKSNEKNSLSRLILAGISFGLALLTKIPAILFIPSFYLTIFFNQTRDFKTLKISFLKVSLSLIVGLLIFGSLFFNPSFGQLFSRGSDFLFPVSEILAGKWTQTISSFPNYFKYFLVYLTPGIAMFTLLGLFSKKHKETVHILFWSGILFIFPIALMGKTVYPRYLFPASVFFTLSALMGMESLILTYFKEKTEIWKKVIVGVVVSLLISNTIVSSINFINLSITDPNQIPFVESDTVQYLTEWSSGHGIKETVGLIKQVEKTTTIAVATEGYFGTLPDGLLMYFHKTNLKNLYVEGIGQPVAGVPESFAKRARDFDKKWLVVNSHRKIIPIDQKYLIAEFCRPFDSPCLQVWDITENFESYIR